MSLCPHALVSSSPYVLVSPCPRGLVSICLHVHKYVLMYPWSHVPITSCPCVPESLWHYVPMSSIIIEFMSPSPRVPCPRVHMSSCLYVPMCLNYCLYVPISPYPHFPMTLCPHLPLSSCRNMPMSTFPHVPIPSYPRVTSSSCPQCPHVFHVPSSSKCVN